MKVVINTCFGGFGLSDAAYEKLIEWGVPAVRYEKGDRATDRVIYDRGLIPPSFGNRYWDSWTSGDRANPLIVRAVEELGSAANGQFADLRVVEVPDGVQWEIDEYDGNESVAEKHRSWR